MKRDGFGGFILRNRLTIDGDGGGCQDAPSLGSFLMDPFYSGYVRNSKGLNGLNNLKLATQILESLELPFAKHVKLNIMFTSNGTCATYFR